MLLFVAQLWRFKPLPLWALTTGVEAYKKYKTRNLVPTQFCLLHPLPFASRYEMALDGPTVFQLRRLTYFFLT